jgi:hypothetical protein
MFALVCTLLDVLWEKLWKCVPCTWPKQFAFVNKNNSLSWSKQIIISNGKLLLHMPTFKRSQLLLITKFFIFSQLRLICLRWTQAGMVDRRGYKLDLKQKSSHWKWIVWAEQHVCKIVAWFRFISSEQVERSVLKTSSSPGTGFQSMLNHSQIFEHNYYSVGTYVHTLTVLRPFV